MTDFGGVIRFTYNGLPLRIRAKVEIEPASGIYTAEDNQDGSFDRYVQPQGPKFDCEFVDSTGNNSAVSQPWGAIMAGGPYVITIVEDSNGIIHSFTGVKYIGRVKVDRLKGMVTGITGQAPVGGYIQTTA
jgi:hypothetical protein